MENIDLLVSNTGLFLMLFVPSMLVGVMLIVMAYKIGIKLIEEFGKPFIEAQARQAMATEKVADNAEATRLALTALADQINSLEHYLLTGNDKK